MGCLRSRDLQTLDKSDPLPRTGGHTLPARLSDDGSPAGSHGAMENFFSLPSSSPSSPSMSNMWLAGLEFDMLALARNYSGHASAAGKDSLASRTILPSPFLRCPRAAALSSVSSSVVGPGLWF